MISAPRPGWTHAILCVAAWAGIVAMICGTLSGVLADFTRLGGHDWDQMVAHRYLVVKTIEEYQQFPFWNPYGCGGHTNWGGLESGVTILSPWLPAYLLLELPAALRVELVGTALLSAWGTWLLAGRFTSSPAARALACAMYVVNGRWAFQVAVGHTWHLYYAWTPWALYFLDRACSGAPSEAARGRLGYWKDAVCAGASVAMMVYTGGIYPLPQTAFIMCLYATVLAVQRRSSRPIGALALAGVSGFGLSSLKLLPILDMLRLYPRIVDSTEKIDLTIFVKAFTAPNQHGPPPAQVAQWGWHEYGIYIGWLPFLVLFAALVLARGVRERALKWCGVVCLLLGFGAFHEYSPWTLAHELPIFKSQHVPVRWQYPATLILGVAAGAAIERLMRYRYRSRTLLEVALFLVVAWVGYDITLNTEPILRGALRRPMPAVAARSEFHQYDKVPSDLHYHERDWTPPALLLMMANVGSIECGTFPGFHPWYRDAQGRAPGLGAKGDGNPEYRGEAYLAAGPGTARISRFTPNEIAVQVSGARAGDLVILNQNWEAGWSVNGEAPVNHRDTLAVRARGPSGVFVFKYRPRTWPLALVIFTVTAFAVSFAAWKLRKRPARGGASSKEQLAG